MDTYGGVVVAPDKKKDLETLSRALISAMLEEPHALRKAPSKDYANVKPVEPAVKGRVLFRERNNLPSGP